MQTVPEHLIDSWRALVWCICRLEEACRSENYLAEDNRWWHSVLELRGPHSLEKGKI